VHQFDGKYYRGVFKNPGNGYIEKVLPNYPGTLIVRYANPHEGTVKLILGGNTIKTIGSFTNTPQTETILFTGGETFRFEEQSTGVSLLLSLTITRAYSQPSPFPLIRLEKNGLSLIEGGKDNAQNETRHLVNHLDKGDKLRLSVSGFFRLRGLKDTTFYGYLLDKDDSAEIVKSTTNLSVNALTTTGDATVGGDLSATTLSATGDVTALGKLFISDASNNLVDAVPKILSGPDHLTCILIGETQQLTNTDEHLKISNIYSRNGSPLENNTIVPVEWNNDPSYYKSVFKNTSGGTITLMVDVHGGISNDPWEMWSATNLDHNTIPDDFTTSHVKNEINQSSRSDGRRIMHTFIISVQNNHYLHIAIKSIGIISNNSTRNDLYTTIDLVKL